MNEATHFYLKFVEGRLVRDPKTRAQLSAKGERKPRNTYWIRRLRSGDIVEVKNDSNMTVEESRTNG